MIKIIDKTCNKVVPLFPFYRKDIVKIDMSSIFLSTEGFLKAMIGIRLKIRSSLKEETIDVKDV
jgi:hypothetical protein